MHLKKLVSGITFLWPVASLSPPTFEKDAFTGLSERKTRSLDLNIDKL